MRSPTKLVSGLNRCRGCGKEVPYVYCGDCAKTRKCAHGNVINDGCNQCDIEGDLAFDAGREGTSTTRGRD